MSQDVLCHAFSFLDYSYTTTLSLVCKEWYQIANSNALWEFYFHLLTNNKKGKTRVSSCSVSVDDLFWKNKIRDNFSQYACRISKKLSLESKCYLNLKYKFPDNFSSQVVKMILSRILLESLESTDNFDFPFKTHKLSDDYEDGPLHFKMKFKISGIDEPLIVRWFGIVQNGFFLFGYYYTNGYYIYFATESDDKLNAKYFAGSSVDLNGIAQQGRAFIYHFNSKNMPADVWGRQYLCSTILSHIVPTVKQYELSPIEFVPYWCFLFPLIIHSMSDNAVTFSKEFVKHYPNIISNRLMYHYMANYYKNRYTFDKKIALIFENYRPNTEIQKKLCKCIIKNKKLPPFNPRKKQESTLMQETVTLLREIIPSRTLKFICGQAPLNLKPEEEFIRNAQTLATFYKLLKNPEEMKEVFLNYKFKRPHQLEQFP
ncbi:F-box domain-containing protein [Naegleria gruberi]|uniref:F-box domain-containing protein n=1 Tax=Naegleria gruberi TaxID=5762 RepID=D2V394_NAEGR|nr:F-box domain-containing protein [Naegleria gruberi]EFC48598.1 F-box domain-containing protein [Naegleria gruberi]|eukprot:XP_002681342.1 F-box domain-containing protein [Naegleria gruberi strain NEG-M]